MLTCTFFGHRDCPMSIKPILYDILIDLIENNGVTNFYVGNHGNFDNIAYNLLRDIKKQYPNIKYNVVLAYLPNCKYYKTENTLYPEGIELVPKRFAIDYRNRFMLDNTDFVVAYMLYSHGGASKYINLAIKKQKNIIYINKK